jgi:type VI secretion system protein ImpA
MASPAILNIDALLAPIAGADPAGAPAPFEARKKLDDARKEINPNAFAPNDPRRPEIPQAADWAAIEEYAQELLTSVSKDLLIAARLTEALTKRHGFGGLRDGLRLMRRMVAECWDRILPSIADGDVEARGGAFIWLDEEGRGASFPFSLRAVPLTRPKPKEGEDEGARRFGWQTWKDSQDAKAKITGAVFDQAVSETPREFCQAVFDDLVECTEELNSLFKELGTRMGEGAPGLSQMRKAIVEVQDLAKQILQRKGPAPVAPPPQTDAPPTNGTPPPEGQAPVAQAARPVTRDDVLDRLAAASAMLLEMEPHSPIAYMVQRAVKLARLPLPDLMKVLVRDPNVLVQLDRDLDLGLEPPDAAKAVKK